METYLVIQVDTDKHKDCKDSNSSKVSLRPRDLTEVEAGHSLSEMGQAHEIRK